MEPLILDKVERLSHRFREASEKKSVVRLDAAYMAVTMDIITHYAYGESCNYVADENFKVEWKQAVIGGLANGVLLRHFPWLLPVLKSVPLSFLRATDPLAASLMEWGLVVKEKVAEMLENNRRGNKAEGTIFQAMLDSDLPPEEKSPARLQDEGQSVVGAGSETTARSLTILSFYLMQDPKKLEKIRKELKTVPRPKGEGWLTQLEKLPYLVCPHINSKFFMLQIGLTQLTCDFNRPHVSRRVSV
jgi:cytochrome P450